MFYSITGALLLTEANSAVLETGGIAYRLTVSGTTLGKIAGKTDKVRLYTYLKVAEDAIELFGFADEEELSTFKMLISVSGVGPKVAISILSLLTPAKLAVAIAQEDAKAISRANGVGGKIAARVVLELKDKLGKSVLSGGTEVDTSTGEVLAGNDNLSEAVSALLVLGYSRSEALNALKGLDARSMTLEDCITAALKKLSKM